MYSSLSLSRQLEREQQHTPHASNVKVSKVCVGSEIERERETLVLFLTLPFHCYFLERFTRLLTHTSRSSLNSLSKRKRGTHHELRLRTFFSLSYFYVCLSQGLNANSPSELSHTLTYEKIDFPFFEGARVIVNSETVQFPYFFFSHLACSPV